MAYLKLLLDKITRFRGGIVFALFAFVRLNKFQNYRDNLTPYIDLFLLSHHLMEGSLDPRI